jgi:hypothetical protein
MVERRKIEMKLFGLQYIYTWGMSQWNSLYFVNNQKCPFSLGFLILYFTIVVLSVHCDPFQNFLQYIKHELTPPSFSFIPHPHSWNNINRSHFSIYINVYRIYPPYSSSDPLSVYPPPCTSTLSLGRTCFAFLFSIFV